MQTLGLNKNLELKTVIALSSKIIFMIHQMFWSMIKKFFLTFKGRKHQLVIGHILFSFLLFLTRVWGCDLCRVCHSWACRVLDSCFPGHGPHCSPLTFTTGSKTIHSPVTFLSLFTLSSPNRLEEPCALTASLLSMCLRSSRTVWEDTVN